MSFRYRVTADLGVTLPPETQVKLTDAQMRARAHQVRKVGDFVAADRDHLSFKKGEIIELAKEQPKVLLATGVLELLDGKDQALPLPPASKPTPAPQPSKPKADKK